MTSRNPFEEIERMFEQMDKGLRSFDTNLTQGVPLDLLDEGDRFVITADLPGYDKDDIEVRLSGKTLRIEAERTAEIEDEDGEYVRRERSHESIHRTVRLPESVVENETDATYTNGVLTVALSKATSEGGGQSIPIE